MYSALDTIIPLLIGLLCLIWGVVQISIDYNKDKKQNQDKKDASAAKNFKRYNSKSINNSQMRFGDENIYVREWEDFRHLSERERDRILCGKIQQFWDKALEYSIRYIEEKDFESLSEFLSNIWGTRDPVESADDLHTLTEHVVERIYPHREIPICRELIYTLCRLVLSNADNYRKAKYRNAVWRTPIWRTPTKFAILLEKDGKYHEAIEVCDFCYSRRIPDFGYDTFQHRKEHLLRKAHK